MSRVVSHSVLYKRGVDHGVVNYGGGMLCPGLFRTAFCSDTRGVDHGVVNYGGGMLCPGLFRTA